MNKIIGFLTGVLYLSSCAYCYAADKFEILPDLPSHVSYAGQTASASTVDGNLNLGLAASQSVGHEPGIISVLVSLFIVITLIYITGIIYAKLNKFGWNSLKKQNGDFAKAHVSVVSTTQLGSSKSLHVIELDGKRMLIGASNNSMQLIKDLGSVLKEGEEEEYSRIEIPNIKIPKIEIPKIEIPSIGFSKILTKAHKQNEEEEAIDSEVSDNNETSFTETAESDNSANIIEDLFKTEENTTKTEEKIKEDNILEHKVDPENYVLYKKYL